MSARTDNRDVLDRAYDIVSVAEFEMTHEPVERCACGATLLTWADDSDAMVCAGCGLTPTYMLHHETTAHSPSGAHGEGTACHAVPVGRGGSPETSEADCTSRKGADAPGGHSVRRRVAVLSAVAICLAPLFLHGWRS